MTREEIFERIYNTYCTWYDMEHCGEEKTPLSATGRFHETSSSYVLTEKATMWKTQSNDYLYVFCMDTLTLKDFEELTALAKSAGEEYIVPDSNHKSSYITALFICNKADADAVKALGRYRFRKDFCFGFKGWEEVHTALMSADDGSICSNKDGIHTAKFLNNIFFPKKKGFFK